ncbi:MAG: hypothetical protein EAZ08_09730 [Cytophagales bacterium]|nr:MAG: hypothetical protein EAZ08_09730 [Cytophagales bacterium]
MAFTFQTQKQFKCNGCGGEISLISKRTNFVGCQYCGAVTDTQSLAYKVITKVESPTDFPPYTFLKVGMIGIFEGKQYKIIGRTRFSSYYKEYWADDDGSGYSDEVWQYDEWQLLGEDFTYFYLIEDSEGFESSHFFYPKYPNLPNGSNIKNFSTNATQRLDEYGSTKIIYFEGEATYQVKIGSTHYFGMYKKGKDKYEVETRLEDSNQLKEISFYVEKHHAPEEILEAFKNDESVTSFAQSFEQKQGSRKVVRMMYLATCIICFLMAFLSLGEENVINQNFKLSDYKVLNQNDSLVEYEVFSDFFTLTDTGRVYGFMLSVEMPDNMDSYTEIEINDDKGELVNDLVGNFYRSSGTDGGENWTEDVTSVEEYYKLDSIGRFQVKMNVQLLPTQNYPQDIKYTLKVYRTDLSRYYLAGFFFFMILAIFTKPPKVLKEIRKAN